jgi:hypothetical protein
MIKAVEQGDDPVQLEAASQAGIDFLQYITFIDPANQALLTGDNRESTFPLFIPDNG